jgi:hypothetical protein
MTGSRGMSDEKKSKTTIILPKVNQPDPKTLRSDFKNSLKQNRYNAPKNMIRKAGPRGG